MAKMEFMRPGYHDDVRGDVKDPAHREIGHRAVDAFFDHLKTDHLPPEALAAVVAGATCPARAVWERSIGFLYDLAARHPSARDAVRDVLLNGGATARFQMVAGLSDRAALPVEFVHQMLRTALADPSRKVREMAATRAAHLRTNDLLPDLVQRASSEPNRELARAMHTYVALLRDGYVLKPPIDDDDDDSNDPLLTVRLDDRLMSQPVPQQAIDRLGLPKIAQLIREASKSDDHVVWDEAIRRLPRH
jgi:hypothetical protein